MSVGKRIAIRSETAECAIRMAKQRAQNVIDCLEGKLQARAVISSKEIGMA